MVDILLIIIVLLCIGFGFYRGLINGIVTLIGIYIGVLVAARLYNLVTDFIINNFLKESNATTFNIVVFLLLIVATVFIFQGLVRAVFGKNLRLGATLGTIDLIGGAFIGVVVGIAVAILALSAIGYLVEAQGLQGIFFIHLLSESWKSSIIKPQLLLIGPFVYSSIAPFAGDAGLGILRVLLTR